MRKKVIMLSMIIWAGGALAYYDFDEVKEFWGEFAYSSSECLDRIRMAGAPAMRDTYCEIYASHFNKASYVPSCTSREFSSEDEDKIEKCSRDQRKATSNVRAIQSGGGTRVR